MAEANVPSRALCSGGGLVAKNGATIVLNTVEFRNNRGREGGGTHISKTWGGENLIIHIE